MKNRLIKLGFILFVVIFVWNIPSPNGLDSETWKLVALYLGVLLGLIIKPFSEPIITLIIVFFGSMFMDSSILLNGYGQTMTWFIMTVTIVSTAFIKTNLGKRIAYNLLLKGGNSTLGLGYTMLATDLVLSPATGSNTARTSIIYPIFRSIAEGAGSTPENEPRKLGAYLSVLMYVISQGTSALFLTGMATNAVTVSLINELLGFDISWGRWFLASVVPMGIFLASAPYILYKIYPPTLESLDSIKPLAKEKLEEMGEVTLQEKSLMVIFIIAVLGWMFGPSIPFVNLNMYVVGFIFLALVLLFGIMDWDDVIESKGAWNIFAWYGGFFGLASALGNGGFYTWLADSIGQVMDLSQVNGLIVTLILLVVSLAVRYFFVSNSAFVASFYPVLFSVAVTTQANLVLVGFLLAYFAGLGSLLTHYGNGAGLITFAAGYVSQKDFWKNGTIMVGVAILIFFVLGLPYWKLIGIW